MHCGVDQAERLTARSTFRRRLSQPQESLLLFGLILELSAQTYSSGQSTTKVKVFKRRGY